MPPSAPETLGNLLLFRDDNNEPVLLRDVARFELGTGPSHIVRENQGWVQRVVGMIPLAIGIGEGAEIAIAVIGGLLGAMLLTLVVISCLYLVSSRGAESLKAKLIG